MVHIPKKILISAAVVLLLAGLAAGFLAGNSGSVGNILPSGTTGPTAPELLGLTGTVKEISGATITLDISAMPNIGGGPSTRQVEVTASTTLTKQTTKDPAQFQAELAAYQKKSSSLKPGSPSLSIPSPTEQTAIKISDIKVGDMLSVNADHDIKTAASFEAMQIIVMPAVSAVPPPPPVPPAP